MTYSSGQIDSGSGVKLEPYYEVTVSLDMWEGEEADGERHWVKQRLEMMMKRFESSSKGAAQETYDNIASELS